MRNKGLFLLVPVLFNLCTIILMHNWTKTNYSSLDISNPVFNFDGHELNNCGGIQKDPPSRMLRAKDSSRELPMEKP